MNPRRRGQLPGPPWFDLALFGLCAATLFYFQLTGGF